MSPSVRADLYVRIDLAFASELFTARSFRNSFENYFLTASRLGKDELLLGEY